MTPHPKTLTPHPKTLTPTPDFALWLIVVCDYREQNPDVVERKDWALKGIKLCRKAANLETLESYLNDLKGKRAKCRSGLSYWNYDASIKQVEFICEFMRTLMGKRDLKYFPADVARVFIKVWSIITYGNKP